MSRTPPARRLALTVVLLVAAGCDRYEEDPAVLPTEPPAPAATVAPAYIKGPATLPLGRATDYRAEPISGATTYEWRVLSTAEASAEIDDSGGRRLVQAVGRQPGSVTFEVLAFGPGGGLVARGRRPIVVVR